VIRQWAVALAEAESLLSDCVEKHLERVIETTNNNISTKAKLTREILTDEGEDDPMGQIESVLTEVNRKREVGESSKNAPPGKKPRGE